MIVHEHDYLTPLEVCFKNLQREVMGTSRKHRKEGVNGGYCWFGHFHFNGETCPRSLSTAELINGIQKLQKAKRKKEAMDG